MASITSEIASSSSSLPKREYDVFLSFRGEDTRNNFTDHLYAALDRKGIWTFKDDERLEKGTTITTELLNAIEKSKFAIIVLSRNYATSSWCLDELVKIVECKEKAGLTVLPVFYGVDPSDVRKQTGSFAEAFAKHELMKNEEKLQSWRAALTEVAKISGYDTRNAKESTIIEEIAGKLIDDWQYSYLSDHDYLVGIQSRVEEMQNLCLRMGSNDVHFIGIWGMGGIGKTTIARVLYDRIRYRFAGSSFLANVREKNGNDGLVSLQKQLLSEVLCEKNIDIWDFQKGINLIRNRLCHKRVLVILDDVDQDEKLKALAGKQSWFGEGSVIIIITRDQRLLIGHEVAEEKIYEPKILDDAEALKLFSLNAFKQDNPLEGYEELSKEFVYYTRGLPLALKVLGSSMFRRDPKVWESVLGRLRECPERKVLDVLQISYDGLEKTEQKIFLDIACSCKGMTKHRVVNILQNNYKPYIDIDVLVEKSLITILGGEVLWMHDLLQELGKEIVRCESPGEPGGRSRLWLKEDILQVLKDNTGTEKVESIFLNPPSKEADLNVEEKVDLNAEAFSKMRKLRLLKICNVRLPQGLNSLSSDLRLMDWPEYPLNSMPKNFNPDKLVELIMPRSLIEQLWEGNWSLKCLRSIDLSNSRELIMTLDFASVPNLEELTLQGCTKLSTIHPSLGDLKHLTWLDLRDCKCLKSLPDKISWESLAVFDLSGCSKLKKFPEIVGNIPHLLQLCLDGTAIEDLPLSMEQECCYRESTEKEDFHVVIPGSEVPNWFGHKSEGASINLEVPSHLFKQFRGIALCAVFGPPQHRPPNHRRNHDCDEFDLSCFYSANGNVFLPQPLIEFSEEIDRVESDHRWFMYLLPNFFKEEFLHQIADGSSCQLEFIFRSQDPSMTEIKKCGAHMVYEEEMEDLKQSMGQSECSSSIIPYNEGVAHFEEDINSKRSRDDENGASSTHIPHPKTKRVRPSDGE